ncbi:plasmid replication, integration and excision activator [Nocardioides sp. NPDC127503]|uniref:plasmid replication, integration and excision activator n=1 Tax=Nocardioides sp. NPDC127503 TaxID=3154516 RepID=UPI00331C2C7B
MAIQRRMNLTIEQVFPAGAFIVGAVEPVQDWDQAPLPDGTRPQKIDKETGLPTWTVPVLDPDPEAGKNEKTVNVKILATHQPVPPKNEAGLPFVPVEFTELVGVPWIDDSGNRPKLMWSLTAMGMDAPGAARKPAAGAAAGSKAAA